jgi:chemotaxis signal transduction protein
MEKQNLMQKKISPMQSIKGLVTFEISGQVFCANIQDITGIINPAELNQEEKINSSNPHIELGSVKIPLMDINKSFGFTEKDRTENARILIVEVQKKLVGFFVEKVDHVYSIDNEMKEKLEFTECKKILYLSGILKYQKTNMFLLDLQSIENSTD